MSSFQKLKWDNLLSAAKRASLASYAGIAVLLVLLIMSVALAYLGWISAAGTDVPPTGYVAMAFGVFFSLVFGIGLMALIFYSSRAGYDEPAKLVEPESKHDPE